LLILLSSNITEKQQNLVFEAIILVLKAFPTQFFLPLIEQSLITANAIFSTHQSWFLFLAGIADCLQDSPEYDQLREFALSACLGTKAGMSSICAQILKTDSSRALSRFAPSLLAHIFDSWNAPETLTLLRVLLEHSPSIAGFCVENTMSAGMLSRDKLDILAVCLGLVGVENVPLDIVTWFIVYSLKQGGLELLSKLLNQNPQLAIAILARGAARIAFSLAMLEKSDAGRYIGFVADALPIIRRDPELGKRFTRSALRLALALCGKYENEPFEYATHILRQSVAVVKASASLWDESEWPTIVGNLSTDERKLYRRFCARKSSSKAQIRD
jgi:hypothetical protein